LSSAKAAAELPHSVVSGMVRAHEPGQGVEEGRGEPRRYRLRQGSAARYEAGLVLQDGTGFGYVGVEFFDLVVELLFDYAAAEF